MKGPAAPSPFVVRTMTLGKRWLALLAVTCAVALPADVWADAVSYEPRTLFDKALAADRAGGQELFAIAWYRAYLAAQPKAGNGERVRERIVGLEVEVEAKARELLNKAASAAALLPEPDARTDAQKRIAAVLAGAGDIPGAERIAATLPAARDRDFVAINVAVARMRNGDGKGALAAAAGIGDAALAAAARRGIARVQAFAGDVAAAWKTADAIADDLERSAAFAGIAEAALAAADAQGGERAIAKAKAAAGIALEPIREHAYARIAEAQAAGGDTTGARQTAALVRRENLRRQLDRVLAQARPRPATIAAGAGTARAEIDDWAGIVGIRLNRPHFTDFRAFWQALRDKQPNDIVEELLRVSADFIDALNELRETEMSWWPRRPG